MNTLLQVLTREGVLITVSVGYWRAHKKLKGLSPIASAFELSW